MNKPANWKLVLIWNIVLTLLLTIIPQGTYLYGFVIGSSLSIAIFVIAQSFMEYRKSQEGDKNSTHE